MVWENLQVDSVPQSVMADYPVIHPHLNKNRSEIPEISQATTTTTIATNNPNAQSAYAEPANTNISDPLPFSSSP